MACFTLSNKMSTRPFISIWFGNFFEPFYSNYEATRKGIAECAALGFNSINLDSKAWEDFFARYRGAPASQYVAMHEFMMAEMATHGIDYTCLALYLCGDNLYPNIRSVPPVRGDEPMRPNGQPMGTYKYWSPKAQQRTVQLTGGTTIAAQRAALFTPPAYSFTSATAISNAATVAIAGPPSGRDTRPPAAR